jgi:histidinol-phosphate/aromatic aminotransferase/cobyric acid decarboxylase-like protein
MAFATQCLGTDRCPKPCRAVARRIVASNNAIGAGIFRYVPELRDIWPQDPTANENYAAIHEKGDPHGWSLRTAVAEVEGVRPEDVFLTGSLLDLFNYLPEKLNRHCIIKVGPDFSGYARGANRHIRVIEIDVPVAQRTIDPEVVARVVRENDGALVYLTFPITNPGQQKMAIEVAEAALGANENAIVVIDAAYESFVESSERQQLARLALAHERAIYLQTASKDLTLCGARFGWGVASENLRATLKTIITPYAPSPASLLQGISLLRRPDLLAKIRDVQTEARDILIDGLTKLRWKASTPLYFGVGPWILVDMSDDAQEIVESLANDFQIDVQRQSAAALSGFVRISATVPCEAVTIVNAVGAVVAELRLERKWNEEREKVRAETATNILDTLAKQASSEWAQLLPDQRFGTVRRIAANNPDVRYLFQVAVAPVSPDGLKGSDGRLSCCG